MSRWLLVVALLPITVAVRWTSPPSVLAQATGQLASAVSSPWQL